MTKRSLRVALAVALAVGAIGVSVLASAPVAAANGPCIYTVTENTYVHQQTSINSVVLKTKTAGSRVTGPPPCYYGGVGLDGRYWIPVDCTCATGGIGYIIEYKLKPWV